VKWIRVGRREVTDNVCAAPADSTVPAAGGVDELPGPRSPSRSIAFRSARRHNDVGGRRQVMVGVAIATVTLTVVDVVWSSRHLAPARQRVATDRRGRCVPVQT